jgi:uncharacterized cupredoxin-like copper-binding protein
MAATHSPHDAPDTEARFTREPESPEPPEPPGRPRLNVGVVVLFAALVFGVMAATGLVLLSGEQSTNAASTVAPKSAPRSAGATAPAASASAARSIAVNLKEFAVNPQPAAGRAGRVTFHVRNTGKVPHEFVVLRTNKAADALAKGGRADETGNVGEIGDLQPGASKSLALSLRPGHYALICNLPGHYLAGQHTDFTVR